MGFGNRLAKGTVAAGRVIAAFRVFAIGQKISVVVDFIRTILLQSSFAKSTERVRSAFAIPGTLVENALSTVMAMIAASIQQTSFAVPTRLAKARSVRLARSMVAATASPLTASGAGPAGLATALAVYATSVVTAIQAADGVLALIAAVSERALASFGRRIVRAPTVAGLVPSDHTQSRRAKLAGADRRRFVVLFFATLTVKTVTAKTLAFRANSPTRTRAIGAIDFFAKFARKTGVAGAFAVCVAKSAFIAAGRFANVGRHVAIGAFPTAVAVAFAVGENSISAA